MWAAFGNGDIEVYSLDANGAKIGSPIDITAFKFNRIIAGLRFDPASTSSNIKLWVSNGQGACDLAVLGTACNDFTGARLTGADLTGAIMPRSVFNGADLTGATLNNAFLFDSRFEGVDLSGVKGLTQAQLDQTCADNPPPSSRAFMSGA